MVSAVLVAVSGAAWWTTRGVLTGFTVSQALAQTVHTKGGPITILLIATSTSTSSSSIAISGQRGTTV